MPLINSRARMATASPSMAGRHAACRQFNASMKEIRELISLEPPPSAPKLRQWVFVVLALWAAPLLFALVYEVFAQHNVLLHHD